MRYVNFILFTLFPLLLAGQSSSDVKVERERVFTGKGLYGFMNGGSDLYLEYGFHKLTTRDVQYKDESYTIDIYEMSSPENAFGIYSLHTFKCMRADTLNFFNCLSAYQYQAVIDNNYISIVFQSGSQKARKNADKLLSLYINSINAKRIAIPSEFINELPYSSSVKYLVGNLSVSNAQPSLLDWLKDINFTGIWLKGKNALIYPTDNENMKKLRERIPKENIIRSENDCIYVKCPEKEETNDYGPFGF